MSRTPSKRATPVREALIQAARLEFAEQGYVGATTRHIAERARTSEVMLFRHFQSKSNLFKEAVFQPLDENMVEFISNLIGSGPQILSSAAWRAYSHDLFDFLNENRSLFLALIAATASEKSNTMNVSDLTSLDTYFNHATEALNLSMSQSDRDVMGDPAIIVRLTFSLVATLALFREWLFPERLMSLDEVIAVMTRFAERALGTTDDASEADQPDPSGSAAPRRSKGNSSRSRPMNSRRRREQVDPPT